MHTPERKYLNNIAAMFLGQSPSDAERGSPLCRWCQLHPEDREEQRRKPIYGNIVLIILKWQNLVGNGIDGLA